MKIDQAADQLDRQGRAIFALTGGISEGEARWNPNAESWSILEVLNHLVDEEVLDFRCHFEHILYTPQQPWPEIDPQGWVKQKAYNLRSLEDSRKNFLTERETSITWLLKHPSADLDVAIIMDWGPLTAGDLLASWLAHDLLHLRQLVELRYHLTAKSSQPHDLLYAGKWRGGTG